MMQVTFKCEDMIDGVPVGPCIVDDLTAADADPLCQGVGMPYGYEPAWREDRGWMSKPQARKVAAQYGVELKEW